MVFRKTAADTGGELVEMDDFWTRPGHRAAEHVHPEMEEHWQIVSGTACFRVAGVERTAGPGEVVVAPPGAPHVAWNPGAGPAHLRLQLRPALRWEEFVERLFALSNEGPTDARGLPDQRALAALMREFRREIAPSAADARPGATARRG